jgi:hypothetical protein
MSVSVGSVWAVPEVACLPFSLRRPNTFRLVIIIPHHQQGTLHIAVWTVLTWCHVPHGMDQLYDWINISPTFLFCTEYRVPYCCTQTVVLVLPQGGPA